MTSTALLIFLNLLGLTFLIGSVLLLWKKLSTNKDAGSSQRIEALDQSLASRFTNLAVQVEATRGDLRTEMTRQLAEGLQAVRSAVDAQLTNGRQEQAASLTATIHSLESKFDQLSAKQTLNAQEARAELTKSLDGVRAEVDRKLTEITGQVQSKLDANIKEGFAHFEKVQEHLRSAEEQLRNVGTLGNSIHDLNNLLKLPHLRGKFGEASLERLLADFLPAHMFTLQASTDGHSRADALINFPELKLPIDAKFPREQVLALFESDDAGEIEEARKAFGRVMKEQAKRVRTYIQPENGTTDMALLYLPSETLYMEAVRNRDLVDEMNKMKVFPVSPNTLMTTLQTIQMVHKWFQVREGLARSMEEFNKAQKSMEHFEAKFTVIGKNLEKAQEAFTTASTHLKNYKTRVNILTDNEGLPLFNGKPALALGEKPEEDDEEQEMSAKA
ncbi:MAG TPA: DNA recombination protein RmuC [Terriglobales bacterium]|nr:DNA recombination protein RmuC [Terriglobales bacterium]